MFYRFLSACTSARTSARTRVRTLADVPAVDAHSLRLCSICLIHERLSSPYLRLLLEFKGNWELEGRRDQPVERQVGAAPSELEQGDEPESHGCAGPSNLGQIPMARLPFKEQSPLFLSKFCRFYKVCRCDFQVVLRYYCNIGCLLLTVPGELRSRTGADMEKLQFSPPKKNISSCLISISACKVSTTGTCSF